MFDGIYKYLIIISIILFVFGIYSIFYLRLSDNLLALIFPLLMLAWGIYGYSKVKKADTIENGEPDQSDDD